MMTRAPQNGGPSRRPRSSTASAKDAELKSRGSLARRFKQAIRKIRASTVSAQDRFLRNFPKKYTPPYVRYLNRVRLKKTANTKCPAGIEHCKLDTCRMVFSEAHPGRIKFEVSSCRLFPTLRDRANLGD